MQETAAIKKARPAPQTKSAEIELLDQLRWEQMYQMPNIKYTATTSLENTQNCRGAVYLSSQSELRHKPPTGLVRDERKIFLSHGDEHAYGK